MKHFGSHIFQLGMKELLITLRDPMMIFLIIFAFTANIYSAYTTAHDGLKNATIAIVDDDQSSLSKQIILAFQPPYFVEPVIVERKDVNTILDLGEYSFNLIIPEGFQKDILAQNVPRIQMNIDATIINQAFSGSMIIQKVIAHELEDFFQGKVTNTGESITYNPQFLYNNNVNLLWFKAIIEVINMITIVCVILVGASLIREYERGTIEHLLVMPVTPMEIIIAKLWSMGILVLVAVLFSYFVMIRFFLQIPVTGSLLLFTAFTALYLFVAGSLGVFLATFAKTMPQFAMVLIVVIIPIQFLSGGVTPLANMPPIIQKIMQFTPTTHYIEGSFAILFKDASLPELGKNIVALFATGIVLFGLSLWQFRKALLKV
ncbi:ABC transporter permease [Ignatzschineria sp. LJL83]